MHVKLNTKVLGDRLRQLQTLVDQKATNSALTHVLLTVANGEATFHARNVNIGMFEATAKADGDALTLLLPTHRLVEISGNLQDESTVLETTGETDAEGTSTVVVKCGAYRAQLRARPVSEFEITNTYEKPDKILIELGLPGLKDMLEKVKFCVPTESGKYTVNVGLLDFRETELRVVATDGWRLILAVQPGEFRTPEGEIPPALTIPKTAFNLMSQLTGSTVTVSQTDSAFFFETETETLATLRSGGKFPPYDRIVPTATPATTFTVGRDNFAYALGRAMPVAEDKDPDMFLSITPTGPDTPSPLIIRSASKQAGMANDSVDVKATGIAQELYLRIDYLLPFVEHSGEQIETKILSPTAIVQFFSGPNYRLYLMPITAPAATK
jgi:DNA polymerase-3 subunit beta